MKTLFFFLALTVSASAQSCIDPEPYQAPKPGDIFSFKKSEWQDMWKAPRDGTVVELQAAYGIALHYGLYRWSDFAGGDKAWVTANDDHQGYMDERCLRWRAYPGDQMSYKQPDGLTDTQRECVALGMNVSSDGKFCERKPWYKVWQ